mmetsp:Transcript_17618/g.26107  ORF Transcript_17618/g.26107 Transcript_17618/m.26107 type:complete len:200 (-) Transcript_17618:215-814(-)
MCSGGTAGTIRTFLALVRINGVEIADESILAQGNVVKVLLEMLLEFRRSLQVGFLHTCLQIVGIFRVDPPEVNQRTQIFSGLNRQSIGTIIGRIQTPDCTRTRRSVFKVQIFLCIQESQDMPSIQSNYIGILGIPARLIFEFIQVPIAVIHFGTISKVLRHHPMDRGQIGCLIVLSHTGTAHKRFIQFDSKFHVLNIHN